MSHKSSMHGDGESCSGVVPTKQPNKSGQPPAEVVEGRPLTKENTPEPNSHRTPCRGSGRSGLERVREAAKQNGKLKHGTAAPRKHRPAPGELLQPEEKGGAGSGRDDVGRICKRPGGTAC